MNDVLELWSFDRLCSGSTDANPCVTADEVDRKDFTKFRTWAEPEQNDIF